MRKQYVDLRRVRGHVPYQLRQASVGVRSGHDIDLMPVQKLVLQSFGHAADDADDHVLPFLFLEPELVYASPYPLFCIVPDGAGVCKNDVGLVYVLGQDIAFLLEDGENDLAVIDIHLTSVGLDIYLRS